jgi:hypothetical protein
VSAYISSLNAAVAREQARRDEQARIAKQATVESLTPLEDRLARVLERIPIEAQQEGLSLASLRVLLRGRQGGNCHCGELGEALRKMGFERLRDWTGRGGGFHTRWYRRR